MSSMPADDPKEKLIAALLEMRKIANEDTVLITNLRSLSHFPGHIRSPSAMRLYCLHLVTHARTSLKRQRMGKAEEAALRLVEGKAQRLSDLLARHGKYLGRAIDELAVKEVMSS